jgi:hypothetical protein
MAVYFRWWYALFLPMSRSLPPVVFQAAHLIAANDVGGFAGNSRKLNESSIFSFLILRLYVLDPTIRSKF